MNIRPLTLDEYQTLIQVSQRRSPADVWFKDVRFLNVYTGQIDRAHIYISGQRIAYVGKKEPLLSTDTEVIELEQGQILVPAYIEPHAHPFQWYNPLTWGAFLLTQGTTVSINDNMFLFSVLKDVDRSIRFIDELDQRGEHIWLWWARLDDQTSTTSMEKKWPDASFRRWLAHPLVVQGGEFTAWPYLLKGDKNLAQAMQTIRQDFGQRIEGHLPGASTETLNILTAAGMGADHEALNGEDVLKRLRLGLYATLRYSSIRPDLPQILKEIKDQPELNLSRLMLTNDGSGPFFVGQSGCPQMLKMVLEAGFEPADAYRLVTLNPATYYGLDQDLGGIAPGRLAHLNVLNALQDPIPLHVMSDGQWVVRHQQRLSETPSEQWIKSYFPPLPSKTHVSADVLALQPEHHIGIELINEVITRPYEYTEAQPLAENESYLSLLDQEGTWVVNTRLRKFGTSRLLALASTYTASRDYLLLGRNRDKMMATLQEALALGGGIVVHFERGDMIRIPLPLSGGMSLEPMESLKEISEQFIRKLKDYGHPFEDPIYSLLFLTATHLPFIRLTREGVYSIKDQALLVPRRKIVD